MTNIESIAYVEFPDSTDIQINMMPFIMGDINSLPENLHQYSSMIDACDIEPAELGKVGYLTITETLVHPGLSQRRGGVHTERPTANDGWGDTGWGRGRYEDRRQGGLYMTSNMADTTAVWDTRVETPGDGGDCEHLLGELGPAVGLKANELMWLTDATPHVSLPVKAAGIRQFFRLVTSGVSLWYTKHSTPNPLDVKVPNSVRLIVESKFA